MFDSRSSTYARRAGSASMPSASFSVSPDKQLFYCFGCKEGGGLISFIEKNEKLEFPDAVALLARQGSDREYGARPLRRAISALVEDPAADLLLEGRMKKGDTLNVVAEDGRVQVRLV